MQGKRPIREGDIPGIITSGVLEAHMEALLYFESDIILSVLPYQGNNIALADILPNDFVAQYTIKAVLLDHFGAHYYHKSKQLNIITAARPPHGSTILIIARICIIIAIVLHPYGRYLYHYGIYIYEAVMFPEANSKTPLRLIVHICQLVNRLHYVCCRHKNVVSCRTCCDPS